MVPASDDETVLLAAVADLLAELYPRSSVGPVRLDSRLDHDLGIDSLGLLELIEHLDHLFDVDLPTAVTATAETLRDLLEALRLARPRHGTARHVPPPHAVVTDDTAAGHAAGHPGPREVATLVEALDWHVKVHPHRCHLRLLGEAYTHPDTQRIAQGGPRGRAGDESERRALAGAGAEYDETAFGQMSYGELDQRARGIASALAGYGVVAGDRVALMLPTSDEYFAIFAGILLAGAVPVPIYPPARPSQLEEHLLRQVGILGSAQVSVLVTIPEARQLARLVRAQVASLKKIVIVGELVAATGPESGWGTQARVRPDDTALLQYTSGSTDNPKGVVLTHANLLANIEAMGAAARVDSPDVFVSWLPLYHDMGLIGAWLTSLYYGMVAVVMTPQAFLSRPSRWLWAIHDHGGTVSAAPNFAYELCSRRIDAAEVEGLDLSSWRIAMNGAEPVSPKTFSRFAERFAAYGLRPEAMTPVYGLAEAGLGLAFPPIGRSVRVDRIEQGPFMKSGKAAPSVGSTDVLEQVSCGMALPGYEIRVVDATGNPLPERREGRVEFRGPSMTAGYFRNPAATSELYDGDWIDTGDLGYLADGEIFVTGRIKDLVVRAGQNLHPEGLEEAIGELEDVRKGCVAAFGVQDPSTGTERLVVVAESRATDPAMLADIRSGVIGLCTDLLGAAPDEIVITPPGAVLKTSSGKIRRAATRDLYQRGRLKPAGRPVAWQLVRFTWRGARPSVRRAAGGLAILGFAAYGWLLLGLLGAPALLAVTILPGQQRRRATAYRAARALVRLTGTPLVVDGEQHLTVPTTFVVVANHASYLDSFALAAVLPARVTFVAGELFATKLLTGFFLKRLGVQFVERTKHANARTETSWLADLVRNGAPLVFFPEGGLSPSPGLRRFRQGAFVVAAGVGCPVVPIAISGTRAMVRPGRRLVRHGGLHFVIGAPIYPTGSDWHAAVDLGHRARAAIAPHCGEPDLA
jgi:1-acyl-sn-glycerol-3-phosphate acyltransferase